MFLCVLSVCLFVCLFCFLFFLVFFFFFFFFFWGGGCLDYSKTNVQIFFKKLVGRTWKN